MFEDNVDDSDNDEVKITKGQGKEKAKANMLEPKVMICKEDYEEEDLWEPIDENSDKLPPRFKTSREKDMHNPIFHVGLFFKFAEVLRKEIQSYS
jgi:hypothetical protein